MLIPHLWISIASLCTDKYKSTGLVLKKIHRGNLHEPFVQTPIRTPSNTEIETYNNILFNSDWRVVDLKVLFHRSRSEDGKYQPE
ncbi:uncharacterized protein OCT59_015921 [Rhizophagus irregularis]|uniref:uncharacterized protein n=1 Tax=Rhizophagus irregularis TaxID=588596 RepID=UPI0019F86D98|nr:hypothetical protein OCT59_015921 [Rhizophagus irregularis]GET53964.1 hypothetical protein RIR_jg31272.t2 [Rhizophagus irregularis DAOM 181602=DAOM 197198]